MARTRVPNPHPKKRIEMPYDNYKEDKRKHRDAQERRDALALENIGKADMDKIDAVAKDRLDNIAEALSVLEDMGMEDNLTAWEYDFWESLNEQYIEGGILTDKQYAKLLQIKVKYE